MNLSTTKYIVKKSLEGNVVQSSISDIADLNRQLSAIGNNLNQLARKANTINSIYADDYLQMKQTFDVLCRSLPKTQSYKTHAITSFYLPANTTDRSQFDLGPLFNIFFVSYYANYP